MPTTTPPVEPGDYRGRMAPSPTGLLHLGHVRTFAGAHRRARATGGTLLLRIDDLDPQRSKPEFARAAEKDLRWLGLNWDGEPWLESRRLAIYRRAWERLVDGGFVYPCRCSRRDLVESAAAPHEGIHRHAARNEPPRKPPHDSLHAEPVYSGICRPHWLPGEQAGAGDRIRWLAAGPEGANWRFRVPAGEAVRWNDGGFGAQSFVAGQDFGDFAVWRRDAVPAYQLSVVVDDAAMGVTEVVRGVDLLLSTARQILLYRAMGLVAPSWFHCPLVLDERGERLAKRADGLSVCALRERGLSAEEVLTMAESARI